MMEGEKVAIAGLFVNSQQCDLRDRWGRTVNQSICSITSTARQGQREERVIKNAGHSSQ